jgi:hypothetical protein
MELCLLTIAFPSLGIGHEFLNFGKYLHDNIRHDAHTTSSLRVQNSFKVLDISSLSSAQILADKTHSTIELVLAKYRSFSSAVKVSRLNNILGDDDHGQRRTTH